VYRSNSRRPQAIAKDSLTGQKSAYLFHDGPSHPVAAEVIQIIVRKAADVFRPGVHTEIIRRDRLRLAEAQREGLAPDIGVRGSTGEGRYAIGSACPLETRSTNAPASAHGNRKAGCPSSAADTLLNQFTLAARSRRPIHTCRFHQETTVMFRSASNHCDTAGSSYRPRLSHRPLGAIPADLSCQPRVSSMRSRRCDLFGIQQCPWSA